MGLKVLTKMLSKKLKKIIMINDLTISMMFVVYYWNCRWIFLLFDCLLFTLVTQPGVVKSSHGPHTLIPLISAQCGQPSVQCQYDKSVYTILDGSQWTFWAVISWSDTLATCTDTRAPWWRGPYGRWLPTRIVLITAARVSWSSDQQARPSPGGTGPRGSSCHIRSCATKWSSQLQVQYNYYLILAHSTPILVYPNKYAISSQLF